MKLELYYSSEHTPFDEQPDNAGFDREEILVQLKQLEKQNHVICHMVDTGRLPDSELFEIYTQAIAPAIIKGRTGYSISRVFGTRRRKGVFFGREVPALLVYEKDSEFPTDIYPHRMGQTSLTIREFLESLS